MNRDAFYARVAEFTYASPGERFGVVLRIAMGLIAAGQIVEAVVEAVAGQAAHVASGIAAAIVFAYFAAGTPKSTRGTVWWYILWFAATLMAMSMFVRFVG